MGRDFDDIAGDFSPHLGSGAYLPLAGGTLTGSLTIASGQTLTVASDTDATTILGRTLIDSRVTDVAYFSHFDMTAAGSFALSQGATGTTTLNSAAARSLILAQGNVWKWYLPAANGYFSPVTDNALDFGQTAERIRRAHFSEYLELSEMTAPAVAPANKARLFIQDNGAGKGQLCIIYATGTTVVLDTEI